MLRTTLFTLIAATAAATAIDPGPAAADDCPGGQIESVTSWHGGHGYSLQLAATGDDVVVGWTVDEDGGWPGIELTVAHIGADGAVTTRAGELAGFDGRSGVAPMLGGAERVVQLDTDHDVGVVVRKPDGTVASRVHLGDYPPYGRSSEHVSYANGRFVVTWASGDEAARVLFATRLDDSGAPLDASPIVLGPAFAYDTWNASARIGGVSWVVWSTYASLDAEFVPGTAPDLVGVRIADDGHLLDASPRLLAAGVHGAALAAQGDVAYLVGFVDGLGHRGLTFDATGAVGPLRPVPVDDDHFLLGVLPGPGGDGFSLWTTQLEAFDPTQFSSWRVDASAVSRAGLVAPTPFLSLPSEGRGVVRAGDDYLLLAIDRTHSGDSGEERVDVRRIHAGAVADVTLVASPLARFTEDVCVSIGDPYDGCQAGGPAGAGTAVLVGLGLFAVRRRANRRGPVRSA